MKRARRYWPRYFLLHDSGFPASSINAGSLNRARDIYKRAGWHTTIIGPVSSMAEAEKQAAPILAKWRAAEKALGERAERLVAERKALTTSDDKSTIADGREADR